MTAVNWQDPPANPRKPVEWNDVAPELRANPGKWALVREAASGSWITNINKGLTKTWQPAGHFEATGRRCGKGSNGQPSFNIYARYIGPPTDEDAVSLVDGEVLILRREGQDAPLSVCSTVEVAKAAAEWLYGDSMTWEFMGDHYLGSSEDGEPLGVIYPKVLVRSAEDAQKEVYL